MMRRVLLFICILIYIPKLVYGAIGYDASSGGSLNSGVGTQLTFSHTSTGTSTDGVLLVACAVSTGGGTNVTSATYAGAAMTELSNTLNSSTWRLVILYKKLPATGANNVVVNIDNSVALACNSVSLTGVDQTTPFGTVATNSGTGDPVTVTATTTSGELVVDGIAVASAGVTMTVGANQTQNGSQQVGTGAITSASSRQNGSDGGVMSWTGASGVTYGSAAVPVKPLTASRRMGPMVLQ